MKKYRIVKDSFLGYECQVKYFWFPFWIQMIGTMDNKRPNSNNLLLINTFSTIEQAESWIEMMRNYKTSYFFKKREVVKVI